MLEQLYRGRLGRVLLWPLTRPCLSRLAGRWMDSCASKCLIKPFIRKNHVDMEDVLARDFSSFNAFFTRELKPGARPIDPLLSALISPCDGLLSVYTISPGGTFTVKGTPYTLASLIGDAARADEFLGGTLLSFRLTSADYHHYVFPDDGEIVSRTHIQGIYHTVRPFALGAYPVYKTNTRECTLLETAHFGPVLFVEVGAMLVGRIVNRDVCGRFSRGEEKGKFEFGGSTILLALRAGVLRLSDELYKDTECGLETRVRMGERVGVIDFQGGQL